MRNPIAYLLFAAFPLFVEARSERSMPDVDTLSVLMSEEEESVFVPEEEESYPALQYSVATNGFWSNWFLQLGADWASFYSDQEHGLSLTKSPFRSFRATPALSFAIGKYTSPNLALRLKFFGFWGRTVMSDSSDRNKNRTYNIQFQPMIDVTNMFCGYNEDRVWNLGFFLGAGLNHSNKADTYALSLSVGMHSSWQLSPAFNIYGELGLLVSEYDADGMSAVERSSRNRLWMNHDNMAYAEVGLRMNIGRVGWRKSVDIDAVNMLHQAEIDALKAQIADLNAENDRMQELLSDSLSRKGGEERADTLREMVCIPVSVFFDRMKTSLTDRSQLDQCTAFVEYVRQTGCKVIVEGYADSATGGPAVNQSLSEKRAAAFAEELTGMGIPRESISVRASGGTDKLSPAFLNRRATATILQRSEE